MKPETATAAADQGRAGGMMLNRHVEIFPDQPLPHLNGPNTQAYAALDRRSPDRPMYALRCHRDLAPRSDLLRGLSRLEGVAMIRPQAWGIAVWPADGREHYFIVFDQPAGPRVVLGEREGPVIREDDIIRKVIPAMAATLAELRGRMISHRAIRASNLFYADESRRSIVLGECVSEPPAYSQPVIYETVESGMAMPAGRGAAFPTNDIYAMGVLLMTLLNGAEPCQSMSAEEIINSKIRLGTYATMMRELRVPMSLMEPLRGMLCDSPTHRWNADDVAMWAGGKRQTTKPHQAPRKMGRPFEFNGDEYWHASTLAHAMACHWDLAVESRPATPLIEWLRKSFGDSSVRNAFADKVKFMIVSANKGEDAQDRVLASLLTVLDPEAPMRFRDVSMQSDSIGPVLAIEYDNRKVRDDFAAAMRARLPNTWFESQAVSKPEFVPLKKSVELTQHFLEQDGWGYGLERCLYELNPGWPCRSPLLDRFLVTRIEHLVPALERMAAQGDTDRLPVDSHIAAFCAAQIKDLPKRVLADLAEPAESTRHRLAVVTLLSKAQEAGRSGEAPQLCRWMFRVLSPAIEGFHNRPYRQKLGERLQAAADRGWLSGMLALAGDHATGSRDEKGFELARKQYDSARREIAWLEQGGLTGAGQVRKGSEQAAILLSSVLSGLALLGLTMVTVL